MGVPTRLGRYVVRRRLGSGGFATVWLAHDEQLDAEVAIKVLADNWAHDDSVRRRFLEEGRFLRRVESEHVVQVHDVGELEDGRPFLVLTYADRGTLADRLKKEPLALESAVGVIVQVGRGLQALHRRGLLHRDVKPANVLFRSTDEGERAVLSDLGLGKSLDEVSRITLPGGTPSYVAPEQAMGERLDQRADQYSLGAVAYAALTGRSPHQVDGLGAAGRVKAAPPPSSLGFDVPDRVDAAIVRALDPNRDNRWPDIEAFSRELVGALDETTQNFLPAGAVAGTAAPVAAVATAKAEPVKLKPELVIPEAEPEVGEKTALSDSNAPTVVKTPADSSTAAPASPAVPESVPASAGTADSTSGPGKPRRRRRGRWVVAAVLALVIGGGAGYAVERYLLPVQDVTASGNGFSVEVPSDWAGVVAKSNWRPPGNADDRPALRVSENDNWALPDQLTPGVFAGLIDRDGDPRKRFPDPKEYNCGLPGEILDSTIAGKPGLEQISAQCGPSATILLQRVVDTGSDLMFVQVQGPDRDKVIEVADSIVYRGEGTP
ncbi:serine/threonine-protein kinase [Kribbella sp. VKM Ac-2568]|uniref:serine/threonine-protein kinase n=1 Tax=Kribbella sp. VKM Ac-2568 TaxID=2512219 RepID=UPI001F5472E8|nr:serine/threonine-protein kinase [Kribbella sp. VKM Ac-2568]